MRCLFRQLRQNILLGQNQEASSSSLNSVPAYLARERRLQLKRQAAPARRRHRDEKPLTMVITVPRCGFSFAVSGMTMPDLVVSSRPDGRTTSRSPVVAALLPLCFPPLSVPPNIARRRQAQLHSERLSASIESCVPYCTGTISTLQVRVLTTNEVVAAGLTGGVRWERWARRCVETSSRGIRVLAIFWPACELRLRWSS